MSRIFISHSSANNGPAVALNNWLKSEGWDDVFLDVDPERGINPGERWEKALNQAAFRCEAVLFLVSRAWLKSPWCLKEFDLAAKLNKRMFGVLIEDIAIKELPSQLTGTWQIVSLAKGADQKPFEATTPDGQVHYGAFSQGALRRLKEGLVKAGLDPRFFDWPPAGDPKRSPYHGLLPMEADDAGIFYGREAPIIETLDKLRGLRQVAASRLLVILGASGSGKSSFLRAGIMPRLARDDRNFLMLPVVRPQRAVLSGETGLFRSLVKAGEAQGLKWTRTEIRKASAADAKGMLALLATLARRATPPRLDGEEEPRPPSVVLAVDQAEELLQAEGGEEAQIFSSHLRDMLSADDANLIVLFTIRSDAYAALQGDPLLKDIHQQPLNLPPVPRGAYQTIIEGPAARLAGTARALKIDPQLTATLLEDIESGGAKDALPLLAFTLERLYVEQGGDGDLRLDEYRELGGISGSIEAAVEQALKAADADPEVPKDRAARLALLRRAFIPWLAGIDPDTGSPRRSIARLSDMPEEALPLVRHLVDQRLLSTDRSAEGEQTIEPAHEALLRQWSLLKGWLVEDSAQLAALEGVRRATRDWLANNRSRDWLAHNAGRLEDAERLKVRSDLATRLASDDLDYLLRCRAFETARKDEELNQARKLANAQARIASRTRLGFMVAMLLAAIAAGFGFYGFEKANEAEERTHQAQQEKQKAVFNEGVALSGLSRVALSEGYPALALKLALAAWPRKGDEDRPSLTRTIESLGAVFPQSHQRLLLKGHESAVSSAVFSPDGTRVVTASWDKTVRLWDAQTGDEIRVLRGHEGEVASSVFSPEGARVVTASWDQTARLWDVKSGEVIVVLRGHQGPVRYAAFSPDGTRVVTTSWDNTARLWDAQTGSEVGVLNGHAAGVNSAAFSPDGTRVATASHDKTVRLWEVRTGAEIAVLTGHSGGVSSIAYSPDGMHVVSASEDYTVQLWDAQKGVNEAVLRAHTAEVSSVDFSPDGMRLVTASTDKTVRLWDVSTRTETTVLKGFEGEVSSAAFSTDGTRVVASSWDNTARLWNVKTEAGIVILSGLWSTIKFAAFSSDGMRLVTTSGDSTAQLWDAKTRAGLTLLEGHGQTVTAAAFSPDGTRVVTASTDTTARLWNAQTGAEIAVLKAHSGAVNSASFSPDGKLVATASSDSTARLWDARKGTEIAVLNGHSDSVNSVAFSRDGTRVVTASADNTAQVWDAQTGSKIAALKVQGGHVMSAAFSPDGTRVVTASLDSAARLWDVATKSVLAVLRGHESYVMSAAFSPDGTRVVTASTDRTTRLWDAHTGVEIAVLKGHKEVMSAAFSPDGSRVVVLSADNAVRVWDISSIETGDAFAIACQRLGNDTDLGDVRARYGLGEIAPICDARPPLPVDLGKQQ